MKKIILLILAFGFSGCAHTVIYKCPAGQVSILEDEGLATQAVRCYTPGVRYNDMRPQSEKKIDHWKEKEK